MKIYEHKKLNYGFIILCTDNNINLLKSTIKSIKFRHPNTPYLAVTDRNISKENFTEMKKICDSYKGMQTFSSLINTGMKKANTEWSFILCAGVTLKWKINDKFSYFIESEKDVLYPIADKKYEFCDSTLNGLLISKKTWQEVGEMTEEEDFKMVKLIWGINALEKGVKFKAIASSKIC